MALFLVGLAGLSFKRPRGRPRGVPNRLTAYKLLQLKKLLLKGQSIRKACEDLGLGYNTYRRWRDVLFGDKRFLDSWLTLYGGSSVSSWEVERFIGACRRARAERDFVKAKPLGMLSDEMRRKVQRKIELYKHILRLTNG